MLNTRFLLALPLDVLLHHFFTKNCICLSVPFFQPFRELERYMDDCDHLAHYILTMKRADGAAVIGIVTMIAHHKITMPSDQSPGGIASGMGICRIKIRL